MSERRALITGIGGQDGSYLAPLLLDMGYQVHGLTRRTSTGNLSRIEHLLPQLTLHDGDVTDAARMFAVVQEVEPDELYNLAGQSHVWSSFKQPEYTAQCVGLGAMHVLHACRRLQERKPVRVYQASSSEMFGNQSAPQSEATPFAPVSPYAVAKVFAHQQAVMHREVCGMHVSCGILFNHESPTRGQEFVTRKIVRAAVRIAAGQQSSVALGNLDAKRDWGHARDYVQAMWLMLQQDEPDDYVIATGETRSVRQFADAAFSEVGLIARHRMGYDSSLMRPKDVEILCGDATKARRVLGWAPTVSFDELVREMVSWERGQNKTNGSACHYGWAMSDQGGLKV